MKSIRMAAAALTAGIALTACSTPVEAGAAAVVGKERIAAQDLNARVQELQTAMQTAKINPAEIGIPLNQAVLYRMVDSSRSLQVAAASGVQVTEAEIDQFVAAAEQQAQGMSVNEQLMRSAVPPSIGRTYLRSIISVQKLIQKFGGGTDQAAQERATEPLGKEFQKFKVTYNPRYGAFDAQQQGFVDTGRFGKLTATTQPQTPQG
ncbi:SurA N-terminal domain-containing protein [Nonomuraea sp. NPDC050310]|uniref:SurA N-terminal domain-containing protein n=1 Tax=unclassified Nonomuraea TaxID=2593643 RepID=UPI0033C4A838